MYRGEDPLAFREYLRKIRTLVMENALAGTDEWKSENVVVVPCYP